MKFLPVALIVLGFAASPLHAQQTAQEMKNGAPDHRKGETQEQKGKRLLDEMVVALGGDAWMNKKTMYREGQTAAFFRGQPTGSVVEFVEYKRFATATSPELARDEFKSWRGMITPGPPTAPSGASISASARRVPSVATARSRGEPFSTTVCR